MGPVCDGIGGLTEIGIPAYGLHEMLDGRMQNLLCFNKMDPGRQSRRGQTAEMKVGSPLTECCLRKYYYGWALIPRVYHYDKLFSGTIFAARQRRPKRGLTWTS